MCGSYTDGERGAVELDRVPEVPAEDERDGPEQHLTHLRDHLRERASTGHSRVERPGSRVA